MKVKLSFNTPATIERIKNAGDKALCVMADTAQEDTKQYVPMRDGELIASGIIHTEPHKAALVWNSIKARYLYYGLLMVSLSTGSAWAKKGESKVKTTKELNYYKGRNPEARKLWAHYSQHKHGERWVLVLRSSFKQNMVGRTD